jgi:hypothetical protein
LVSYLQEQQIMNINKHKTNEKIVHLKNVVPDIIDPIQSKCSSFVHLTSAFYGEFSAHIFWSRSHSVFLVNLITKYYDLFLEPNKLNDAPGSKFTPADLMFVQMQAENYVRDYLKEPYLNLEFKMSSSLPVEFNKYWEFYFAATIPSARDIKARCFRAH